MEGIIVKGIGGFYYILGENGSLCEVRAQGKLRHRKLSPLIGDRVNYLPGNGEEDGWIVDILPRESELIRPAVANIHRLIIVVAPSPEPDLLMVDTLLVMACRQHIQPALLINKCDLDQSLAEKIRLQYRSLDMPVLSVSGKEGTGIHELQALLREGICAFAGQSGVGKSTLASAATGLELQAGEISRKISRGRHTTRHSELLIAGEYRVMDTPGFSLLELWEGLDPVELKNYYPEFAPYEETCRFFPCYHLSEPDCAVLQAVQEGRISGERMERYHLLLQKAQEAWKNRYH